jgi:TatD DNase family protein
VPTDRLLLESDAPVLAPQPRRGRTNEPSFVAFTLDCLSDVRNVAQDELASQIAATADNVFRWGSA